MIRTLLIIIFGSCTFSLTLSGQVRIITGTITAKEDGEPLTGVNVIVKGTTEGSSSDVDGKFSVKLEGTENVLEFSYIGYITQAVEVGAREVVDVILAQDVTTLSDVVVVGYGTQRKSDLTGAVSSVRGSDLTKIPSLSAEQALQGKVAGVQVTSTSGEPGALPVVRVRGVGTFNNSSPIYVVDGVILNNISFLNSGDIQSLEVLKDASSTAIYGSRGANGVIIVTTKHGKAGQEKPVIAFGAEYSVQMLSHKIDLLNGRQFGDYVNQITPGSYNNLDVLPNTDWQDLVFSSAPMQNYQLSASGASAKSSYYVGACYFNQQGIVDKSSYERLTVRFNNSFTLSKNITIGNNISFAPFRQEKSPNVTYAAYRAQPVILPFNPDGSFAEVPGVGNPLAILEYSNDHTRGLRLVGNVFGEVTFLKSFTFRSSFGTDLQYDEGRTFTPVYFVSPQQQNEINDLYVGNNHNVIWLWENTLNYNKSFGKHTVDALAGYTMQEASSEKLNATGQNVLGDAENLWYLNADNINPTSVKNEVDPNINFSMISYLFRVNYTYDQRYLLTATFRRDGSSKFLEDNRYGNFPSFAVGWNIANEEFMKGIPVISRLKVRASWGVIGNEKISYLDQYALVSNGISPVFGANEVLTPGSTFGKTGNPDLVWESTSQSDVGLEVGLLNDRLSAEFDFYNRQTDDILVELSTPGFFGNGQGVKVRYNAGSVLNRGLEMNFVWQDHIGGFKYRIGALGSTLHNEVVTVGGNSGVDSVLVGGDLGNGQTTTLSSVGNPIGAFFGYQVDGIFQNEGELASYPHASLAGVGDLRYVDVNGDGKISSLDRVYLGSPIPTFIYGFSLEGSYKGFDLSLDFQGQTGNKIYNGKDAVRPDLYNFETTVLDYWRGEGTSTTEPRPSSGGVNYEVSERFIQDGSFLRLRSVTLGYTLPTTAAGKAGMSQARIYLRGTNVFTLTEFTGYTPEIGSEDVLANGIDKGIYPVTTIYSAGINLTF